MRPEPRTSGGQTVRAYAQGAWLHGSGPERYCVREVLANGLWGLALPAAAVAGAVLVSPAWLLALAVYPALYLRIARAARARGFSGADASLYARWVLLGKLPQALGQCGFAFELLRRLSGRVRSLNARLVHALGNGGDTSASPFSNSLLYQAEAEPATEAKPKPSEGAA